MLLCVLCGEFRHTFFCVNLRNLKKFHKTSTLNLKLFAPDNIL